MYFGIFKYLQYFLALLFRHFLEIVLINSIIVETALYNWMLCETVSLTASESFSLEYSARQVIVYVKYGIRIVAVTDLECPSKSMVEISYNKLNECVIKTATNCVIEFCLLSHTENHHTHSE